MKTPINLVRLGRRGIYYLAYCALLSSPLAIAQGSATIVSVTPVEGINVEHGTSQQEVLQRLPRMTTVMLDDGRQIPIKLQWQFSDFVKTARGANIVPQV